MNEQHSVKRALTSDAASFWAADPMVFTLIWLTIMILVVICPFVATRERRRLCFRRITERNWNVEGVEMPSILPVSGVIERSYPIGDPRRRYTKEDADNETKKFIIEKLTPFTKIIDENDFIRDGYDSEIGQKGYSLKNQSLENLTTGTENTSGHSLNENSKSLITDPTLTDQEIILENDKVPISARNGPEEEETKSVEESQNDGMEKYGIIVLPNPGVALLDTANCSNCTNSALKDVERQCISSECSICLAAFAVGDNVSWSSLDCDHIFHQECIVEWLMTLGKKKNCVAESNNTVMQIHLCSYDMVCPVCRKDFIPNARRSN